MHGMDQAWTLMCKRKACCASINPDMHAKFLVCRASLDQVRRHPWVTAGGQLLPAPRQLPDAEDPANEFTFNEGSNLATVNERFGSGSGALRGECLRCAARSLGRICS
jgi:hypothetical protein